MSSSTEGRFVRNAWYVAAWSSEVGDQPLARKIIGEPLVAFRNSRGAVIILSDTCPHRFAPLHRGKVIGDQIECGYHGLRFADDGQCVFNPRPGGVLTAANRVASYPVVERDTFVWVWMGAPDRADPSTIPAFPWLTDGDTYVKTAAATMVQRLPVELIVDNLMDLSHGAYIHRDSLNAYPPDAHVSGTVTADVTQDGCEIHNLVQRDGTDFYLHTFFRDSRTVADNGTVDLWTDTRFNAPTTIYFEVGIKPPGEPRAAGEFFGSVHALTPCDADTTEYRWLVFRNYAKGDPGLTAEMEKLVGHAFVTEDEPMIGAVRDRMAGRDFWSMRPITLAGDQGAIAARRCVERLVEADRIGVPASVRPR
jgi:vanillate O-demethylase monooxygenase subunit